jgi:hypothetical protein
MYKSLSTNISKPTLILVRDIIIGRIYADQKTDLVVGRLKYKTIVSTCGMHQDPVFCLQFEIDEFSKPTIKHCEWDDKFYEVAEPKKPSLFQLAKEAIIENPQMQTNEMVDEILALEQEK